MAVKKDLWYKNSCSQIVNPSLCKMRSNIQILQLSYYCWAEMMLGQYVQTSKGKKKLVRWPQVVVRVVKSNVFHTKDHEFEFSCIRTVRKYVKCVRRLVSLLYSPKRERNLELKIWKYRNSHCKITKRIPSKHCELAEQLIGWKARIGNEFAQKLKQHLPQTPLQGHLFSKSYFLCSKVDKELIKRCKFYWNF